MHLRCPTQQLRWDQCNTVGTPPPHRIHSSAALVGAVWVLHGGRMPGRFAVSNGTYAYDFETARRGPPWPPCLLGLALCTSCLTGSCLPVLEQCVVG